MSTQPEFELVKPKKLIGIPRKMSLLHNTTSLLFSTFMQVRSAIENTVNSTVYDLREYPNDYFLHFNPASEFKKWALMEVTDFNRIPQGMDQFRLTGGTYAVFSHRGKNAGFEIFEYIFLNWLPSSGYLLDPRPHFEKLDINQNTTDSEKYERIYIPVSPDK